ncbi:uncharacterized protein [Clytia hemisphaerica]|uniref:uncharacterized protein n=1 Tax=Clytia hemisphaerica TaxID=252671 RepID=UPI0034D58AA3
MTTRYSNENTYGPKFTGWEKVSCLREDMFGDQCKSNGITFALRVRASNTTSTRKDVIFITPHAGTDIGYRVVYTTNGDIVLGIWANTFHMACQVPMATKEIYKWHHYVIAIRIQPFLKMLCYDNGLVIGENEDSRPVPGGGESPDHGVATPENTFCVLDTSNCRTIC